MKKATNSALMRIKNEKIILSIINSGPVSRAGIAKKTGLTKAAVTIIVDDLKQRGIVFEKDGKSESVGRNPVMLYLNSNAFFVIGVNISRRDISVGIVNLAGDVIEKESFAVCGPDEAFEKIGALIDGQISRSGIDREKIYKLAVVTPGPVDTERGMILNPPNFKLWHNTAVVTRLREMTGFDVVFENVSSAIAIAEKYFGSAVGNENFLAVHVDEGIGTGIVIKDALFKGPCEFGHISIKFDGVRCECGNRGCLEKYASIPGILKNTNHASWQDAVDSADSAVIDREAGYLSVAIISANSIFNLDKVVLCGELTYKPEYIIRLISDKVKESMLSKESFEICAGGVKSKYLTAAAIAIHDLFS